MYLWIMLFTGVHITGLLFILFQMSLVFVGGLIFVPIALAIWSGILHLCLYLVGGAREGYEATFRVVSYSSVTGIFNAIPCVGILASLWGLVLTVIGLRETHKTTTGKAVAALAIPLGIVVTFIVIVGLIGTAKLASLGWSVPKQACQALETYIARVDGAAGLDAQALESEIQDAARDLQKGLEPFNNRPRTLLLQQKAILFGMAAAQQAKVGIQFGKGLDELRDELRKTCKK